MVHAVQDASVVPPVTVPYLPATQFVHAEKAELPAVELEFDGQAMQVEVTEAPTDVEYVPAPQVVHVVAPVDVK